MKGDLWLLALILVIALAWGVAFAWHMGILGDLF